MEQLAQRMNENSIFDPIVLSNRNCQKRAELLKDWFYTPLYRTEINGVPLVDAIVDCAPENQILDLAQVSRDSQDPLAFNSKILLEITLKRSMDITELEYQL